MIMRVPPGGGKPLLDDLSMTIEFEIGIVMAEVNKP